MHRNRVVRVRRSSRRARIGPPCGRRRTVSNGLPSLSPCVRGGLRCVRARCVPTVYAANVNMAGFQTILKMLGCPYVGFARYCRHLKIRCGIRCGFCNLLIAVYSSHRGLYIEVVESARAIWLCVHAEQSDERGGAARGLCEPGTHEGAQLLARIARPSAQTCHRAQTYTPLPYYSRPSFLHYFIHYFQHSSKIASLRNARTHETPETFHHNAKTIFSLSTCGFEISQRYFIHRRKKAIKATDPKMLTFIVQVSGLIPTFSRCLSLVYDKKKLLKLTNSAVFRKVLLVIVPSVLLLVSWILKYAFRPNRVGIFLWMATPYQSVKYQAVTLYSKAFSS